MRTRVALAEDHHLVRERLRRVLAGEPRMELIAEAENGREALRHAFEFAPDVLVMDIRMPLLNGIEATRAIRQATEKVAVLILSLHCDAELARRALRAGATGVMLKEEAGDLALAISLLAKGATFLSPKISALMRTDDLAANERLSEREQQVFQLMVAGVTGPQIAHRLSVDPEALDGHRQRLLAKLSAHGASDLARWVKEHGDS